MEPAKVGPYGWTSTGYILARRGLSLSRLSFVLSPEVGGMSKPMSEIADEVLLQRARTGDRAAFVTFAARFWPRIGHFVWSMIGNASQASAITEEVVGEVLKSAEPPGVPAARLLYWLALRR